FVCSRGSGLPSGGDHDEHSPRDPPPVQFNFRDTAMLTDLDETLMHQTSLPFQLAETTDHRFYDRYYVTTFAPDGSMAIINGMGVYKNMNVMDGFACTRSGMTQRNQRFSRPLRPDLPGMSMSVGPMRTEILEPYKKTRFVCAPSGDADAF